MISIRQGDLAAAPAAAVLRAVSAEWDAVTASGRRLEMAAGPELEAQCRRMGELPVGSAVITAAGTLRAQFVVHVVLRSSDEPVTVAIVRKGLQNGLRRVTEWGIESVAMAPLGTGAGNLDAADAARAMIPVLLGHLRTSQHPAEIEIVVESAYEQEVFERELRSAQPAAETGSESPASG
ncbi:MAG: macro domain-containing protein [Longimicrobiales bacterium]